MAQTGVSGAGQRGLTDGLQLGGPGPGRSAVLLWRVRSSDIHKGRRKCRDLFGVGITGIDDDAHHRSAFFNADTKDLRSCGLTSTGPAAVFKATRTSSSREVT